MAVGGVNAAIAAHLASPVPKPKDAAHAHAHGSEPVVMSNLLELGHGPGGGVLTGLRAVRAGTACCLHTRFLCLFTGLLASLSA